MDEKEPQADPSSPMDENWSDTEEGRIESQADLSREVEGLVGELYVPADGKEPLRMSQAHEQVLVGTSEGFNKGDDLC